MQKHRATFSLDPKLLRATRIAAARSGQRDSEVVEAALREYLAIGVLEAVWSRSPGDLDSDTALQLAVDEQHAARRGE